MSGGQLKHKLTFQRRGIARNSMGTRVDGFGDLFLPVKAAITELRGGEEITHSRLEGKRVLSIKVRATSKTRELKSSDRAVNQNTGTIYNIKTVDGLESRSKWLTLLVETDGEDQSVTPDVENTSEWLLAGGVWNDAGRWDDTQIWGSA